MRYIVDIDGTICSKTDKNQYEDAMPYWTRIDYLNRLHDEGHEICYWTARGSSSGIDWTDLTRRQLKEWGAKYTSLELRKPSYDVWIDDKAVEAEVFFSRG